MLPKVSMLTVIFAKNSCIIIREFKGASPFNSKFKKQIVQILLTNRAPTQTPAF